MQKIRTDDGSETFYSEKYQEPYHTKSGAAEEAVKKFVAPCLVQLKQNNVKILDVCFGLGYNTAAALDVTLGRVEVVGLENDERIFEMIGQVGPHFKHYNIIKQLQPHKNFEVNNIKIKIIMGDARQTISDLKQTFDVVFLDPFSPKKCPELWTEHFFHAIYNRMKKPGVLTTYSYARSVRENLKKAGFTVEDGPVVGRRSPSTVARKE